MPLIQQGTEMELQGSVTIPATVEQVWQALNDPEVLRLCIPGCEEVRQISPEEMHARVLLKMGPVRATFVGKVRITDVRPLQGYTLNFEGSGGAAGFARGSSVIALSTTPAGSRLDYTAQASIAGKLGQIGGRLIDASARQLADRFFAALQRHLSNADPARVAPATAGSDAPMGAAATPLANPDSSTAARAQLPSPSPSPSPPAEAHWLDKEKPRLLWFAAGVAATALGVWLGAHGLR